MTLALAAQSVPMTQRPDIQKNTFLNGNFKNMCWQLAVFCHVVLNGTHSIVVFYQCEAVGGCFEPKRIRTFVWSLFLGHWHSDFGLTGPRACVLFKFSWQSWRSGSLGRHRLEIDFSEVGKGTNCVCSAARWKAQLCVRPAAITSDIRWLCLLPQIAVAAGDLSL